MKCKPDLSAFRKAIFGDVDLTKLDWIENKEWVIQRVFYEISEEEILNKLMNISQINDSTPIQCLKGKYGEFIVEDLQEAAKSIKK